ncbi:class I SAM-dependent methyltransferase [Candidatus Woesearchaeota archaeon]|nr:class I SAM-dependent methyltransferase [Candidatus Woesearchaeota archaeon]
MQKALETDDEKLKKLTSEHYDKYTFIEPNIEESINFIQKRGLNLLEMAGKKDIVGIDISAKEFEVAKGHLKHSKLEIGDATDLRQFEDKSFTTVICYGVAHHTPNPKKVFGECSRICSEDGIIIFAVYNKRSMYYYDYKLFKRSVNFIFKKNLDKYFMPIFRLWRYLNHGGKADDKTVVSWVTDRYMPPIVEFYKEGEIKEWAKEKNLEVLKTVYVNRKSMMNFLLRKPES